MGSKKGDGQAKERLERENRSECGQDGKGPSKFRLPQPKPFDGLKDLQDHLNTFKMTLGLQQPLDEILCRSFPTTLKAAAREWFMKLPNLSIDNFEQLSSAFLSHFIRGQRPKRPVDYLFTVKQGGKGNLEIVCETLHSRDPRGGRSR